MRISVWLPLVGVLLFLVLFLFWYCYLGLCLGLGKFGLGSFNLLLTWCELLIGGLVSGGVVANFVSVIGL